MDQQTKDDIKTNALIATASLTKVALLKSMTESKTLTIMVVVGVTLFSGFGFFLTKMAG